MQLEFVSIKRNQIELNQTFSLVSRVWSRLIQSLSEVVSQIGKVNLCMLCLRFYVLCTDKGTNFYSPEVTDIFLIWRDTIGFLKLISCSHTLPLFGKMIRFATGIHSLWKVMKNVNMEKRNRLTALISLNEFHINSLYIFYRNHDSFFLFAFNVLNLI